jgi:hypothetical protein
LPSPGDNAADLRKKLPPPGEGSLKATALPLGEGQSESRSTAGRKQNLFDLLIIIYFILIIQ